MVEGSSQINEEFFFFLIIFQLTIIIIKSTSLLLHYDIFTYMNELNIIFFSNSKKESIFVHILKHDVNKSSENTNKYSLFDFGKCSSSHKSV